MYGCDGSVGVVYSGETPDPIKLDRQSVLSLGGQLSQHNELLKGVEKAQKILAQSQNLWDKPLRIQMAVPFPMERDACIPFITHSIDDGSCQGRPWRGESRYLDRERQLCNRIP